nr:bacteriophage abortive infection AbiH family protein [uncultured Prevotella sp.]
MQIHSLFPQHTKQNKETLFIIGNGFDLYHGILSSYANFRRWLLSNDYSYFVNQLDFIFDRTLNIDLWSDFENALGSYDYDSLYHEYADEIKIDYDHMMRSAAQKEDAPISAIRDILADIQPIFAEWVDSIVIKGIKPVLTLFTEAKYITFNYTKTLECVYGIPTNNILHIHGCVGNIEDIVVGHGNIINPHLALSKDEDMTVYEENGKTQIIESMNELAKDVKGIMSKHMNFFKSLSNIQHVIVYGHSLSDIDRPYFELIKKSISPIADWRFSQHSQNDINQIRYLVTELKIQNWKYFPF